jgi:hypothetical protein
MSLELPFGIKTLNPIPLDYWSGPYSGSSTQEALNAANSGIPEAVRYKSMEVSLLVNNVSQKYWYKAGTLDQDLIPFNQEVSATRIYSNINSDYSVNNTVDVVFADSTNSSINVYIPTADSQGGKELTIKKVAGELPVNIVASGAETIDGNATVSLFHLYESITLVSNNSNWFIT